METWLVNESVTGGLKVRNAPVTGAQVQSVWPGDKLEGVLDMTSGWINIARVTRATTGSVLSPVSGQWWCSGHASYVTKQEPPPPPPVETRQVTVTVEETGWVTATATVTQSKA